jgi:hypothetical protein
MILRIAALVLIVTSTGAGADETLPPRYALGPAWTG